MTHSPTDKNPPTGSGNAPVSAEKRFDLAEGFIKTVLNLATGALVFSVTFLHEIVGIGGDKAPAVIQHRYLVAGAWIAFWRAWQQLCIICTS
jgi:hypothetical protein